MTEFLLVRHGETDWNRDGRWQGWADPPLNNAGREQARDLAEALAGEAIDAIVSSDLARARETAGIVAALLGLEVVQTAELRELHFGAFEGMTTREIELRYPEAARRIRERSGWWDEGESPAELRSRVEGALRRIAGEHPNGRVIAVAHGGCIRALLAGASGQEYFEYWRTNPTAANCSVFRVVYEDGAFTALD